MEEFDQMVSSQRKGMLYLLGFFVLGFIFIPPFRDIFLGLFLGGVISLINLFLLHAQGKRFANAVVGEGNFIMAGPFLRLVIVCATIFLAFKFATKPFFWSFVIGVLTSYVVMIAEVFIRSVIEVKNQK